MSNQVDTRRRDCAISVLGGPTTVVDIAGRRIVMDPTFDPPGEHAYLTKVTGPSIPTISTTAAVGSRWPPRWCSPTPARPGCWARRRWPTATGST